MSSSSLLVVLHLLLLTRKRMRTLLRLLQCQGYGTNEPTKQCFQSSCYRADFAFNEHEPESAPLELKGDTLMRNRSAYPFQQTMMTSISIIANCGKLRRNKLNSGLRRRIVESEKAPKAGKKKKSGNKKESTMVVVPLGWSVGVEKVSFFCCEAFFQLWAT